MKIKFLLIFIGLFLTISLNAQDKNEKYIPKNLDEAISQLNILFPDTTKNQIMNLTENEFLGNTHFSTGMWIRNNWGLWKGKELAKFFNNLGISHPDDMSGIILTSYYRHLHNQDLKIEEQVEYYQRYWKESNDYNTRLLTNTIFARQEKEKHEKLIRDKNEELRQDFPIGTKVSAWVDYSAFGSRSEVIGEIVDWRTKISKGGRLGSREGPEIESEYLEAKIKVIKFKESKKQKRIERRNHMDNDELWVNINLISKIE